MVKLSHSQFTGLQCVPESMSFLKLCPIENLKRLGHRPFSGLLRFFFFSGAAAAAVIIIASTASGFGQGQGRDRRRLHLRLLFNLQERKMSVTVVRRTDEQGISSGR